MGHCRRRGSQVLLGQECHLHVYEQGGVAQVRTRQHSPGVLDILQPAKISRLAPPRFPGTRLEPAEGIKGDGRDSQCPDLLICRSALLPPSGQTG